MPSFSGVVAGVLKRSEAFRPRLGQSAFLHDQPELDCHSCSRSPLRRRASLRTPPRHHDSVGKPKHMLGAMRRSDMRTIIGSFILSLASCWSTSAVFGQGVPASSSVEAEVRADMAERRKASLAGDTNKVASLMADEYLQTDVNGHVQDKSAWLIEYFKPLAT